MKSDNKETDSRRWVEAEIDHHNAHVSEGMEISQELKQAILDRIYECPHYDMQPIYSPYGTIIGQFCMNCMKSFDY